MVNIVMVEMNAEDARLFREFQKHHAQIVKLLNARVFDIRNGAFVTHLDGAGQIKKIERHDHIYLDP